MPNDGGYEEERSLQDKAYDLLGDMLIERDTNALLESLRCACDRGEIAQMNAFFARQDQVNRKKIAVYCRKQIIRNGILHVLPRIAQAAAVIITVITLTGGVAIAASHTVRVRVMQLLVHMEERYTEIKLVEDEARSFDVPQAWKGKSYISNIPEAMELDNVISLPEINVAEYRSAQFSDMTLKFLEANASSETNVDTEGACVQAINLQGTMGYIAHKENTVTIFWSDGQNFFVLTTHGLQKETAISVACSVKRIQ